MTLPSAQSPDPFNAFVERIEPPGAPATPRSSDDERALQGWWVGIKDCFFHRGRVPTMGSRVAPAPRPGPAVALERIEASGGCIAGYTNLHEWAIAATSAVTATGPILNPWDRARLAGGSSGGSAAAVAAGLVDAAVGTDAGGSIRIPATCCGIVGFKPSFELVPTDGYVCAGGPTDHIGALARSTRKAAALVSVMAGTSVAAPVDVAGARIGVASGPAVGAAIDEVSAAVEAGVGILAGITGSVAEVDAGDFDEAARVNGRLFLAWTARVFGPRLETEGSELDPSTYALLERGARFTADEVGRARADQERWKRRWAELFATIDVLVTPTLPVLALPVATASGAAPDPHVLNSVLGSLNGAMNLAGAPCLSLPCGDAGDLTVNMSLTAAPGNDALVVALGAAFEDATERRWVDRTAPS